MKDSQSAVTTDAPQAGTRAEVHVVDRIRRGLYTALGSVALLMGVIGIFVPIWPTTCFVLLAAACYGKGSARAGRWLRGSRWVGRHLVQYQEAGTVPRHLKGTSLLLLWTSIGLSAAFLIESSWVRALLLLVAVAVTIHVGRIPSAHPSAGAAKQPATARV